MSDKIDQSLIRNLVREVISEVIAGGVTVRQGQDNLKAPPAARKLVVEEVTIASDADLSRFVKHLIALSKDTAAWLAVEEGTRMFRFKDGAIAPSNSGSQTTPAGKVERIEKDLLNEARVAALAKDGVSCIVLGRSAVLTPLGRDKARELNVLVEREKQ
jgi:hypothetical protein